MATEKRLISVDDCPCDGCKAKPCGHPARCVKFTLWLNKTVDAVPAEQFNTLKSLVNGEWVDCKLVQEALGIDFATGLKLFDFSRTAEWNPAPLNGQKITTRFRLKNTVDAVEVVHGRWEILDGYVRCSVCGQIMDEDYNYCPNCGAKMDGDGK